jgi:hypothetical protein
VKAPSGSFHDFRIVLTSWSSENPPFCGDRFADRCRLKHRVRRDGRTGFGVSDAVDVGRRDLEILDDGDADAGHVELLHQRLDDGGIRDAAGEDAVTARNELNRARRQPRGLEDDLVASDLPGQDDLPLVRSGRLERQRAAVETALGNSKPQHGAGDGFSRRREVHRDVLRAAIGDEQYRTPTPGHRRLGSSGRERDENQAANRQQPSHELLPNGIQS